MSNIDALAAEWIAAKKDESDASKRRLKIELELIECLDVKSEGSITHKLDQHKVTMTQNHVRKIDVRVWEQIKHQIPFGMHPVKKSIGVDVAGMKWLTENEPTMWATIAPAFETKPSKVGVKVEEY